MTRNTIPTSTAQALIGLALLQFGSFDKASAAPTVVDGVAAVVNGEVITISDVTELVALQERSLFDLYGPEEFRSKSTELRSKALEELINRRLIIQEFNSRGLKLPERYLRERIQEIVRNEFGGDRAAFLKTLQAQGYTLKRFEKAEEEKFVVQAMRQLRSGGSFVASPAKVREYYDKKAEEFSTKEEVRLSMISIAKTDESGADNKALAEEILTKIKAGTPFSRMAQMYSEDSMNDVGGDWGWIDRKTLNPELTNEAFKVAAGQTSEVIAGEDAYYIIRVEERKAARRLPLSEVRSQIEERVISEQKSEVFNRWMSRLREKAYIKTY